MGVTTTIEKELEGTSSVDWGTKNVEGPWGGAGLCRKFPIVVATLNSKQSAAISEDRQAVTFFTNINIRLGTRIGKNNNNQVLERPDQG